MELHHSTTDYQFSVSSMLLSDCFDRSGQFLDSELDLRSQETNGSPKQISVAKTLDRPYYVLTHNSTPPYELILLEVQWPTENEEGSPALKL